MGHRRRVFIVAAASAAALASGAAAAAAAGPSPLSADTTPADARSADGSGVFGRWGADARGLPRYRYTADEERLAAAARAELEGGRDAWHQLGNDRVVANAYNHGHVQLWSQDRLWEWLNKVDAARNHHGGGFGWLRVDGRVHSTLYDDRSPGARQTRDFGVGHLGRTTRAGAITISERVYAPFGDDPLLLHDVTLHNTSRQTKRATWFEYWDVNPQVPGSRTQPGIARPVWDRARRTLAVRQHAHPLDATPHTIFAASLAGPVGGWETDGRRLFARGSRKAPAGVVRDRLTQTLARPAKVAADGATVLAFRAPVTLRAGQRVTLRYAFGAARASRVAPLVRRWRAARTPFRASQAAWRRWLPRASFGAGHRWLARELAWDAYMLRSGTTYEECAGAHVISQGGYYQYDYGFQGAFRDPLQHVLPMIYAAPRIARDVLRLSAAQQPRAGEIGYARHPGCRRFDGGKAGDLDLWLLLTAAEYGLATRDLAAFDEQVGWEDGGRATLWEHLKAAYRHQESLRLAHGGYDTGTAGDWSDISPTFTGMTESILTAAQTAYIYPRLAELADLRGDRAFAAELRTTAAGLLDVVRREWTGQGWFSRGYAGDQQLGRGVIYGEPQPWALLAGAADPQQAATLVRNIRRYLTGVGAPGGPSPIGSSQSPSTDDPGVTERSGGADAGIGNRHAVFVGGTWFAINGWLTWALGELDGIVPGARELAFDELARNTLTAHARAYPRHWNGILSVDDACRSWYSTDPGRCGIGLTKTYAGQVMHQPAWSLFAAIRLAGVTPTRDGYRIAPHLPQRTFSLRLPNVGVAARPGELRGYLTPAASGTLRMRVAAPGAGAVTAWAGGRRVPARRDGGDVVFDLRARAGRPADWALTTTR